MILRLWAKYPNSFTTTHLYHTYTYTHVIFIQEETVELEKENRVSITLDSVRTENAKSWNVDHKASLLGF